jgi:hypothetical protein
LRRNEGAKRRVKPPPRKKYVGSSKSTSGTQFVRTDPVQGESERQRKREAVIFGGRSVFVPDPRPRVGKLAPPPPPLRMQPATRRERERERERQERAKERLALLAPVRTGAAAALRLRESPEERALRIPPPPSQRDRNPFQLPGYLERAGSAIGQASEDLARGASEGLLEFAWKESRGGGRPGGIDVGPEVAGALAGAGGASKVALGYGLLGPDLLNATVGAPYSERGLKFDIALLPLLVVARPIRGGRAVLTAAGKTARGGEFVKEFDRVMGGPSLARQAIISARRSPILRVPERPVVHAAVNAAAPDEISARAARDQIDAVILDEVRKLPRAERRAAASEMYDHFDAFLQRPEIVPEEALIAREVAAQASGRAKHLPPDATTPEALELRLGDLRRRLQEGLQVGRGWYDDSGKAILEYSGGNIVAADKLAALTALYSPQQAVVPNIGLALRAMEEFNLTRKITVGGGLQIERATAVMNGENWLDLITDPDQALKIRSFYGNLLKYIDQDLMRQRGFTGREVTADGWIGAAFGYGFNTANTQLSAPQYRFIERTIQWLADEHGLTPDDAQAAIWMSVKAERDRYLSATYAVDPAAAIERAGDTFRAGLEKQTHNMRMAVEAMTAEKPWLSKLTLQQRAEYTHEVAEGVVKSLHEEGLPARLTDEGIGFWVDDAGEISTNPAFAVEVPVGARPRTRKGAHPKVLKELYQSVTSEQRAFYNGLTATINDGLSQAAGGWVRPLVSTAAIDHTAWEVNLGRQLTQDEMQTLGWALDGSRFYPTQTSKGFMLVSVDPDSHLALAGKAKAVAARDAEDHVARVLDAVLGEQEHARLVANNRIDGYTHRGGYVDRSTYQVSVEAAGRSDLLERLAGRIGNVVGGADARWREVAGQNVAARASSLAESNRRLGFAHAPPGRGGGPPPRAPDVAAPPAAPEPPGGPPEQWVMPEAVTKAPAERAAEALPGAGRQREMQEAIYSEERATRAAAYEEERQRLIEMGLSREQADAVASQQLAGPLKKVEYKGKLRLFDEAERETLYAQIDESALRTFERKSVRNAIRDAAEGVVPQRRQLQLLKQVFGKQKAEDVAAYASATEKRSLFSKLLWEVGPAPRTLQTTLDVSYLLRQALVAQTRHPIMWGKNIGPSIKAMGKEGFEELQNAITARANFDEAISHGLAADMEIGIRGQKTEEAYMAPWLSRRFGIRHSAQAYTFFLNKIRMDMWDHLAPLAKESAASGKGATFKRGAPRDEEQALKDLASYINSATGRGTGGKRFEQVAGPAAAMLFSPRLLKSRFNFLNPFYYVKLDPFARKQALTAAATTLGQGVVLCALASQIPGVTVGLNPTSANFGRIRIGDTRIDIWGGFQPIVRVYAQLLTGVYTASTSGKEFSLKEGGFGQSTRLDIAENFARSKLAPNVSLVLDWLDGQNMVGEKFQWRDQWTRVSPMIISDLIDTYRGAAEKHSREEAAAATAGAWLLGAVGFGVQTYGNKKKKKDEDYWGDKGTGGSDDNYWGDKGDESSDDYWGTSP